MASLTMAMSRLSVGTAQSRPAARTGPARVAAPSSFRIATHDGLSVSNRLGLESSSGMDPLRRIAFPGPMSPTWTLAGAGSVRLDSTCSVVACR